MLDSTSDVPQFKTCSNPNCPCDNPQPLGNFNKQPKGKYGLNSRCRTCTRLYCRQYYQDNIEQERQRSKDKYQANTDFYLNWRRDHKDQNNEASRRYRAAHPEVMRAWQQNNHDKLLTYDRRWKAANRDKLKKSNKRWQLQNPDKNRAKAHRRRALERKLPRDFSSDDWQYALAYFNGCCAVCGRPSGLWHTLAMDHWIPVTKGGGYTASNIVPLCHGIGGCNNTKQNKDPEYWLTEKFGKRKARAILQRIQTYFDGLHHD